MTTYSDFPDEGGSRRGDRPTAKAAARLVDVTKRLYQVLNAIEASGEIGATWWEIERTTGIPPQSVSPRFTALCKLGLITSRRDPMTGVTITRKGGLQAQQTVWFKAQPEETVIGLPKPNPFTKNQLKRIEFALVALNDDDDVTLIAKVRGKIKPKVKRVKVSEE